MDEVTGMDEQLIHFFQLGYYCYRNFDNRLNNVDRYNVNINALLKLERSIGLPTKSEVELRSQTPPLLKIRKIFARRQLSC